MLVLTRKIGEQIIIGDNIRVTVVSVGPGRVKIGIEAPPSVVVDRQEVFDKKREERAAAAPVGPPLLAAEAEPAGLHNRIATIHPVPMPAVAAVGHATPAPRPTTVGNPTPAVIRARLHRKPR